MNTQARICICVPEYLGMNYTDGPLVSVQPLQKGLHKCHKRILQNEFRAFVTTMSQPPISQTCPSFNILVSLIEEGGTMVR